MPQHNVVLKQIPMCPGWKWLVAALVLLLLVAALVTVWRRRRRPLQLVVGTSIPMIVHQVWVGSPLPAKYAKHIQSWKDRNPQFEHRLYDDTSAAALVRKHYPQHLAVYLSLDRPVQRADMLRYMAIHQHGGFYADMDTTCLKPLRKLCGHSCVVGSEILDHKGRPKQFLQWFFGAAPQHPLMLAVLDEIGWRMRDPKIRTMHPDMRVLHTTGPQAFTDAVRKTMKQHPGSIKIFDPCSFGMYNMHLWKKCEKKAYLKHHFEGEWKMNWPDHLKNY